MHCQYPISLQVGRNESGTIPSILVFLVIKSIHFKFWRVCDWLRLASHVMPRATVCGCVVVLGVAWATAPMQTERIVEQRRGLLWTASLHLQPLWTASAWTCLDQTRYSKTEYTIKLKGPHILSDHSCSSHDKQFCPQHISTVLAPRKDLLHVALAGASRGF